MDFDEGLDRVGTNCAKWDFLDEQFGRDDVLPMWVADSDWRTSEAVIKALQERVKHGAFGYSKPSEEHDRAVMDWVERRYGWNIDPEWIVYTNSITSSLSVSVRTFSDLGDSVVVQPPVYFPFFSLVENSGRRVLENQLEYDGKSYRIDFEDLHEKFSPCDPPLEGRTSMMILCNPHNPVGRVWKKDELETLAELALEEDVMVVSDEIFSDYVYKGEHTPFSSISEEVGRNSITLITPSKSFNIAGLKIGVAVIPDDRLRERFENARELLVKDPNVLGLTALKAAYDDGEEWLDAQLDYLERNKKYAFEFVENEIPNVKPVEPEGTFLLWIDFNRLGLEPEELEDLILNEAKVALIEGSRFGSGGEGFMRLNFACPRDTLKEGLERIRDVIR
ncbi:MAG: MalY/PatB family protein [Candidatus Natronoplasma sp.]